MNFFLPVDKASRRQSVDDCVRVVNARRIVNYCKMTERLEQRYCIKFCQKLGDTQVETIRKIQQAFGDDAMSITRIKECTTASKMAARQLTANHVTVGPQLAEMTMSSTKCGLW